PFTVRFTPVAADGTVDLDAMLRAVTDQTRLIIVCNPNNPTGGFLPLAAVQDFLLKVPAHVAVVLDEAYWEMTDAALSGEKGSVDLLKDFPQLIITRTFSKYFALAGIRVGYALLADPRIKENFLPRFGREYNAVALAGAIAALKAEPAYHQRAMMIQKERQRLFYELTQLHLAPYPTQTNFIAFSWPDDGRPFADAAIHLRFGPTLDASGLARMTIGTPRQNDRVLEVMQDWMQRSDAVLPS
ncbi:MAG: aminotransferase class I/II-fold pyridoxal phosphate-dependent enzyme, partial [Firmicutes bacterium]|nr:aminotransferase class I/II-fold pyridoxal phosphate-dependent enzyme [Bacillota bacterium]